MRKRILSGAIAVERELRRVNGVGADVMRPTQIGVVAKTAAGIQKSEELRGIALAPLETFVQRQPIVLAKVLVQSQADIVGIGGNRGDEIEILNGAGSWAMGCTAAAPPRPG